MVKKSALTSLFLLYTILSSLFLTSVWRRVSDFEFIIVQTLRWSSNVKAQKMDHNTDEKTCVAGNVTFRGSSFVRASFIIVFLIRIYNILSFFLMGLFSHNHINFSPHKTEKGHMKESNK